MPKGKSCKVCNSPNLNYYEKEWFRAKGKLTWTRLVKMAQARDEKIGRKSFANHFEVHYQTERIRQMLSRGTIEAQVSQSRAEAIDILDEIVTNLKGLKALIEAAKGSKKLGDVVAVYREHRLTLQDIERLTNSLRGSVSLSRAELYQEIFWACSELCPKCREKFWVKLDERLRSKGFT